MVAVSREHWDEGKGTLHLKRGGAFIIGPYLSAPQLVAQNRTRVETESRHPAFLASDCMSICKKSYSALFMAMEL